MDLIKRLLGSADKPQTAARPSESRMPELDARTATRRELLRVLTRDTQRFAGIPESWIESRVLLEQGTDGQPLMHLRLVLKHWDAQFMQYLVAFQRRLMGEIERFEPDARQWVTSISWQLSLDDECPHLELPAPATWGFVPAVAAAPVETPRDPGELEQEELEEDLAKFFAVRDAAFNPDDAKPPRQP